MDIPRAMIGPLGQKLLFYQGYVYTMKSKKNARNLRWICQHNKLFNCNAFCHTDNNGTLSNIRMSPEPHTHPPNEEEMAEIEKQLQVKNLALRLLDDNVKPGDLVNELSTYKTFKAKTGQVSVASLKRQLRKEREKLRSKMLSDPQSLLSDTLVAPAHSDSLESLAHGSSSMLTPDCDISACSSHFDASLTPAHFLDTRPSGVEEASQDFTVREATNHQDFLAVPSTSGIATASTSKPSIVNSSQPHVRPYIPVQADDKVSHIPERHELKPTPNPVVAAPEPDPLATRGLHPLHMPPELNPLQPPPELDPLQPPPEGDPLKNDSPISVKWNTYANNMSSIMPSLLEDEKFVDVTLACDGKYIKCHKVILGACSPYFEELLSVNPCQHPIILMRDFYHWEIRAIVDFIYCGFVNIPQHKLPRLLQVANVLQIKGLTGTQDYTESMLNDNNAMPHNDARDIQTPQSNLRKRSELPPESKSSEVPSKRKKTIPSSSRRNSFESRASEEGSIQSEGPHSTGPSSVASISVSLDPPALEQSVLIKEETNFYTDPPDCRYRSDQNMDPGNFTQIGHYQPFASSSSSNFKQEFIEDIDRDPLGFESGVS